MARRSVVLLVCALACLLAAPTGFAEDSAWVREEFNRRLGSGITALNAGDARGAAADLCWAARRGLNSARANLFCGRALLGLRRPDEAIPFLELSTELSPTTLRNWVSLGDAFLAAGRLDRARASYFKAIELRTDHSPAYDGLARLAYQSGNEALALENFDKALEANPTDARARLHRGQLHLENGRYDRALGDIREAARLRPDDAEVMLGFSRILLINGLANQSLTAARKAERLKPMSARVSAHIARIFFSLGAYRETEEMARLALERDPDLSGARLVLAEVLGRTNRLEEAIGVLTAPNPELLREQERVLLAEADQRWRERQQAIAVMDERVAEADATSEEKLTFGEALVETGQGDRGAELALAASAAEDASPATLRRAAAILLKADQLLEASRLLQHLDALGAASATDLTRLGESLELSGAATEAESVYKRAIASDKSASGAYGGLARLAFAQGDKKETIRALVAFLASEPPGDDAIRATEALSRLSPPKAEEAQPAANEEK